MSQTEFECDVGMPQGNGSVMSALQFAKDLESFTAFGTATQVDALALPAGGTLPVYTNEYWTSKQRQGSRLHEVSYRACFKPQLPLFFIERLTLPGDIVYDPFMGRGTTLIEAALRRRVPMGCDVNPLSRVLVQPRLALPDFSAVESRLKEIDFQSTEIEREDLLAFYHRDTLKEITSLRAYFLRREAVGSLDVVDAWIRMVATNRLTGHSSGFFSVYSLPPNQAVTVKSQLRINKKRQQVPERRDVASIILKKAKSLLNISESERLALAEVSSAAQLFTCPCNETAEKIAAGSVALVVTSPPFLDEVDYETDNWLRCWFNGFDSKDIPIWMIRKPEDWQAKMTEVFHELFRVLKPGGYVAFEVGEVRKGKVKLEELVVPAGQAAGLSAKLILINAQEFTKTSNCWGVDNAAKGTNTNRIVLFQKPD